MDTACQFGRRQAWFEINVEFNPGRKMKAHFVLKAPDGRMVTNDTDRGVSLTKISGLCYVWTSEEAAERERPAYQAILGTVLTVAPNVTTTFLPSTR